MIITKTLRLYDEGGGEVCDVDAEWQFDGEGFKFQRLVGDQYMLMQVRKHIEEWMVPDDADVAGAKWAAQ